MKFDVELKKMTKDIRSCFPPVPHAITEGKALFEKQDFERKLSIVQTARAITRACAAFAGNPEAMKQFFKADIIHFQHLYCMDWILNLMDAQAETFAIALRSDTLCRPEHRLIQLQIVNFQCEISQDMAFGFSRSLSSEE